MRPSQQVTTVYHLCENAAVREWSRKLRHGTLNHALWLTASASPVQCLLDVSGWCHLSAVICPFTSKPCLRRHFAGTRSRELTLAALKRIFVSLSNHLSIHPSACLLIAISSFTLACCTLKLIQNQKYGYHRPFSASHRALDLFSFCFPTSTCIPSFMKEFDPTSPF